MNQEQPIFKEEKLTIIMPLSCPDASIFNRDKFSVIIRQDEESERKLVILRLKIKETKI